MTEPPAGGILATRLHRKCSGRSACRRASTILRYLDNQDRPDRQIDACDIQARKLSAELNVITGGGAPEPVD